jgi:hypothetical protein
VHTADGTDTATAAVTATGMGAVTDTRPPRTGGSAGAGADAITVAGTGAGTCARTAPRRIHRDPVKGRSMTPTFSLIRVSSGS